MKFQREIKQSVFLVLTLALFFSCGQADSDDKPGFYKEPDYGQSQQEVGENEVIQQAEDSKESSTEEKSTKNESSFKKLGEAIGDLDKDDVAEKVIVYNTPRQVDMGTEREIHIFKKKNGSWELWHKSIGAVLPSEHGGMMGDPFESINVERGAIVIKHFGGSNQKWAYTHRFRYQNDSWELIGATIKSITPCQYFDKFDYNLSLGKYIYTLENTRCNSNGKEIITAIKNRKNATLKLFKTPEMDGFYPGNHQVKISSNKSMYY